MIGGGAKRHNGGGAEGRRRRRERKRVKSLSEGRGKCINDPVAAGLSYMAMVGRMVTILPHAPKKKFGLRHSVLW